MKVPVSAKWRGYVRIQIHGVHAERVINALLVKHIQIWDVARTADEDMTLFIMLPDALRLRPLLKETGCRMKTLERYGLPYSARMLRRRSFFIAGLFLFMLGLYMLSSLVWSIEVKGTNHLTEEQVLAAAREEGIYPLQWSFRLADMTKLSKGIHSRLDDTSWVGVTKRGTKVMIHVVESTVPKARDLKNPRDLVAKVDAVVTKIFAEEGKIKVRPNMKVSKGTVLISGNVGGEGHVKQIAAKGNVFGLVWHEYVIEVPLVSKQKVYTGEQKVRNYAQLGVKRLKVSGFGDIPFEQYEIIQQWTPASWKWLPQSLGMMNEKVMEVQLVSEERSESEAIKVGMEQARADILSKYGKDAEVKFEKILHHHTDSGKVKLNVLFEVEQSIVDEKMIIHSP